jgi:hypothetical protein
LTHRAARTGDEHAPATKIIRNTPGRHV